MRLPPARCRVKLQAGRVVGRQRESERERWISRLDLLYFSTGTQL